MKLRIRPEARQDLRDIGRSAGGEAVCPDLERAVRFSRRGPRVGRERPDLGEGLRSFPVGNDVIFYRLLDGVVEIVNVIHGSRDIESLFGRQDP